MAINNRRQRRRRRHRQRICHYRLADRQNPLENLPECEVFQRFRFRPQTILYIVALLNPFIQRDTTESYFPSLDNPSVFGDWQFLFFDFGHFLFGISPLRLQSYS